MGPAGLERCDVPAVEGKGLAWPQLRRHAAGVVLTGLFAEHELLPWRQEAVLARHGNETFYADNTRGNYAHPKLEEYVRRQNGERMIFVSDTLQGAFGAAWRFASGSKGSARRKLLRDFAERPIFSVGVAGSGVPSHDGHPETWHALLSGVKAWWLGRSGASKTIPSFRGWEDPCGAAFGTVQGDSSVPEGVKLCIQRAGEVLYFGEGVEHSTCSLSNFSLAVGAQGHTEHWPELPRAANRGDLKTVRRLLKRSPAELAERQRLLDGTAGRYGHSALHRAALHGFAEVAEALLAARADPTLRDSEGLTPSFLAAFSGHAKVLEQLGASLVDERDMQGATTLQWAATQGHKEVVDFLLARGAQATTRNSLGGGPVSAAATTGHREVLLRLLQSRGSAEEADDKGMRPLHWAALQGHKSVVAALLQQGARADARNTEGQRPLELARGRAVKKLLRKGRPKDDEL